MILPRFVDVEDEKFQRVRLMFGVIMGALCLVTAIGNIMVIYIYRKASMLGNLFIISLAVADLIVGTFVMPIATIYAMNEVWTFSDSVCILWLSADYIASTASILNLLALSIDRYMAITSPLQSLSRRTKSKALTMIAIAWLISCLWVVPITTWHLLFPAAESASASSSSSLPLTATSRDQTIVAYENSSTTTTIASNMFSNVTSQQQPQHCTTPYDKSIVFKVTTCIFNFYVPLIALIAINVRIYMTIHQSSQQAKIGADDNDTNTANGSIRIRRTHRNNKQVKAFRTLVLIVVGFTVCFTPYFTVYIVVALCEDCVSIELFTVTLWLGYLNSTLNPFLYALSNRHSSIADKKRHSSSRHKHYHNHSHHNHSVRHKQSNNQTNEPSLTRSVPSGGSRISRTPADNRNSFLLNNNSSST